MNENRINIKTQLQRDNIYFENSMCSLSEISNLPTRKGLQNAILSNGQIVNVVSKSYYHLPNEIFFETIDRKIQEIGMQFLKRSINRENRSFAVDYILNDDNFFIHVKNSNDILKPMLRFTNSYDGSCRTSGHFGFYRQVCSNGLHIATTKIGFSLKHTGLITSILLPEIGTLIEKFINNEFYTIQSKFQKLADTPIYDLEEFTKKIAFNMNFFKYASSEKNPAPAINARIVMDTVRKESNLLDTQPNMWIGYNAFNDLLHTRLKRNFQSQKVSDELLFKNILAIAEQ